VRDEPVGPPLIYTVSPAETPPMLESAFHAVVQDWPLPEDDTPLSTYQVVPRAEAANTTKATNDISLLVSILANTPVSFSAHAVV